MSWTNRWVERYGSYSTEKTIAGVTFSYVKTPENSTIKITGKYITCCRREEIAKRRVKNQRVKIYDLESNLSITPSFL